MDRVKVKGRKNLHDQVCKKKIDRDGFLQYIYLEKKNKHISTSK